MAIHKIKKFGSKALRKKAQPVTEMTDEIKGLINDMVETMIENNGLGLAAPQVDKSLQVVVTNLASEDGAPNIQTFINPEVFDTSDEIISYNEGCLSVPEINEDVLRPKTISLTYLDEQMKENKLDPAEEMLSRVLQHEIDHLNGILFVDRISLSSKSLIEGTLKKMAKENR